MATVCEAAAMATALVAAVAAAAAAAAAAVVAAVEAAVVAEGDPPVGVAHEFSDVAAVGHSVATQQAPGRGKVARG